jgi:hypothetical protein
VSGCRCCDPGMLRCPTIAGDAAETSTHSLRRLTSPIRFREGRGQDGPLCCAGDQIPATVLSPVGPPSCRGALRIYIASHCHRKPGHDSGRCF